MYVGWMTLGGGTPLDRASNFEDEIINNTRTLAYAQALGVGWLLDCHDCDSANDTNLLGVSYDLPHTDPAPWWQEEIPERAGFCGVYGVEITGAEDATRRATVSPTLNPGGIIGALYRGPRTMTLRAIAVADSEASLQEGMLWFRNRTFERSQSVTCDGSKLTFFYACPPMTCREFEVEPCPCDDMDTPGGPCWATTYGNLKGSPPCAPTWWPNTYGELKAGPPTDDEWCHWVYQYYELRIGAPAWSCGADACLIPYVMQFDHVVMTEGPTVISHQKMNPGAMMEIEMTIVAGDPDAHRLVGHPL